MGTRPRAFSWRYAGETNGPHYEQWREEFVRRWVSVDVEPIEGNSIVNEIRCTEHSFIGLCSMRGSPLRFTVQDASNYCYLILAAGSRMHASQYDRSIELAPGEMTLMSAERSACLTQLSEGSRWSIRIPQRLLTDICRNVPDKITRPIGRGELTKLLWHQVETADRFAPGLDAAANYAIAQHVLDLAALCLGADGDAAWLAERRGLAAARLDAIKAAILRNLGRSDLTLAHVAAEHGLSTRYVQHLFELSGLSFTGYVLEQRLLNAHRLLREPKGRWRKVSDIATAAGFSDISYFNRAFKARFGGTPTEIRATIDDDDSG
jgi:AraC-like DNA-binding protein